MARLLKQKGDLRLKVIITVGSARDSVDWNTSGNSASGVSGQRTS